MAVWLLQLGCIVQWLHAAGPLSGTGGGAAMRLASKSQREKVTGSSPCHNQQNTQPAHCEPSDSKSQPSTKYVTQISTTTKKILKHCLPLIPGLYIVMQSWNECCSSDLFPMLFFCCCCYASTITIWRLHIATQPSVQQNFRCLHLIGPCDHHTALRYMCFMKMN